MFGRGALSRLRANDFLRSRVVCVFTNCRGGLAEIICKPKILPLKSAVLEQLQKIERAAEVEQEDTN